MTTPITPTQTKIDVAVLASTLAYIRQKIDEICTQSGEQDKRLDKVERYTWAIGGIASFMAAILIPVAVAAIRKWLGL